MFETDRIHPIIQSPHTYELVHLTWDMRQNDFESSYLVLHLKKGDKIRKLRFLKPVEVQIDNGFYGNICGMEILDISKRQLDRIGVEVNNFEQDAGITFKAQSVELIE